jgi:hypothetical protein
MRGVTLISFLGSEEKEKKAVSELAFELIMSAKDWKLWIF